MRTQKIIKSSRTTHTHTHAKTQSLPAPLTHPNSQASPAPHTRTRTQKHNVSPHHSRTQIHKLPPHHTHTRAHTHARIFLFFGTPCATSHSLQARRYTYYSTHPFPARAHKKFPSTHFFNRVFGNQTSFCPCIHIPTPCAYTRRRQKRCEQKKVCNACKRENTFFDCPHPSMLSPNDSCYALRIPRVGFQK